MKVHKEELRKIWELNPVWDVLTDEQKQFIDSQIEVVSYKKNEIIHHEGDVPTHMLMLVSGKIRIYKEGTGQRQQIIRVLKPYDFFGYRATIAGDVYNSCASAFEPSIVYKVNRDAFLNIIQHNNEFCFGQRLSHLRNSNRQPNPETYTRTSRRISLITQSQLRIRRRPNNHQYVYEP